MFNIRYYHDYISPELANYLFNLAKPVKEVPDLIEVGSGGGLESKDSLLFLCKLYAKLENDLNTVLNQRILDRKFIDERVKACYQLNKDLKIDFLSSKYKTILGLEDAKGRIVIGPHSNEFCNSKINAPIAPIPDFLKGPHVTLFGPPDSAKMAINAMNTYHRKLKSEPAVVEKILANQTSQPKWGADDEDSKTPLRSDLIDAGENLNKCFEENLSFIDPENKKEYKLAGSNLSLPIKRFPGLALPCTFLFYKNNPIPLHLYDFVLHVYRNWHNSKSLTFYVPKLENEEEARYIHKMVFETEKMIKELHPSYELGTVRLMIVLENPRAILRTHEIIDALYPYFVGASLGWHDYLGSTARLFKEDANYRIPVKADPDIVIKYIKASHNLLADVVGSRGGIKVGGMYGILPLENEFASDSFQITIKGYIKDVITQLKRNLTGFWVAHPDFVRIGLALVEAWKQHSSGQSDNLFELVKQLLLPKFHEEVLNFISSPDIDGLDKDDPNYVRSLIVADIKESDFIANNHPDEIRYNVFQSLQYLTDWLSGNGCVALPAHVHGVPVRVMDDLATAERSRWEVWHEIYHNRFSVEDFLKIAFEEMQFIKKDLSNEKKIVQVKWTEKTEKWYPVAFHLMIQLMTAKKPVEFATELLMPFTVEAIRQSANPLEAILKIEAEKYTLDEYISRFLYHFEVCGNKKFASALAKQLLPDMNMAESLIKNFNKNDLIEAANFHGNIGESKKTLDSFAKKEQSLVFEESIDVQEQLCLLGAEYLNKFGVKFLISAKSKTGKELLLALQNRINNSFEAEINNAKEALWEITKKRYLEKPTTNLFESISKMVKEAHIDSVQIALSKKSKVQSLNFGNVQAKTYFELASLSKTLAAAFSIEFFNKKNISLDSSVNTLLKNFGSTFALKSDLVTLRHLMNHTALNMHYVDGYKLDAPMPPLSDLLKKLDTISEPGKEFHYSGGGFILLEYLIELIEKKSIQKITENFFEDLTFEQNNLKNKDYAIGYFDNNESVASGRLKFPAFAAGAMGTASAMAEFLNDLTNAYQNLSGEKNISHDTARTMLYGTDQGSREFMGCDMGLGVFIAECGDNKLAIHQGANEGFRCLYIHCFDGPNVGDGFVILANSDKKAVLTISLIAQLLLKELKMSGVDYEKFKNQVSLENVPAEQLVNLGYKQLIFNAFTPCLPEKILIKGPTDPLSNYNVLASASILKVSNQKFARAENLISPFLPTFDPELFGKQGKIMDSWESARHNVNDADYLILQLSNPSDIQYIHLSTKFHDGNQAEFVKIWAMTNESENYVELLPSQKMLGHSFLNLTLHKTFKNASKIKIEMFPDGGLTRVGLYASLPENFKNDFTQKNPIRYSDSIPKTQKPLSLKYSATAEDIKKNQQLPNFNLAGEAFGAKLISATNEHYGPAAQVISPFQPIHMFDGLESARSRNKDHFEDVIIELAKASKISRIIFDFTFFVNNNPLQVSIEGFTQNKWELLVQKTNVKAFAANKKEFLISDTNKYGRLKIKTYPDGGINRVYVFAD